MAFAAYNSSFTTYFVESCPEHRAWIVANRMGTEKSAGVRRTGRRRPKLQDVDFQGFSSM